MAETLSVISTFSFIAAGFFAIAAVVLWFVFEIPSVIGDLSGRTARKSIERRRKDNEKNKAEFNPYRIIKTVVPSVSVNERKSTELLKDTNETALIEEDSKTLPLMDSNVVVADSDDAATVIMNEDEREENILTERRNVGMKLAILDEVIMIHTDEEI